MALKEGSPKPAPGVNKKIRRALLGLIKGAGDVVASTIEVTREGTARALRGVRGRRTEAPRVAGEAVTGAIQAASEGGAELGSVTKGAVIGAIQGVGQVTKVTGDVISDAVQAAVKASGEVGGDVTTVARKAVEGAIEAGRQAGWKAEDAAAAGAAGAIQAAEQFGEAVATAVTRAVTGTISGVRVVLKAPSANPVLLAVNSNRSDLELLMQHLESEGYEARGAASLAELDQAIRGGEIIALALIDLSGFDQSIWERCDRLRRARIPFLVISPQRSPAVLQDSLRHGARGVLIKPVGNKELTEYIRGLLGG